MTTEELKIKISVDTAALKTSVNQAKKTLEAIDPGKKTAESTKETTKSFEELRDSLDQVRNAQWADILIENLDAIKKQLGTVRTQLGSAMSGLKDAKDHIAGIFTTDAFENSENLTGYLDSLKIASKEASDSIKNSAASIGQSFKAMGSMAKAAINSTIAQIALLVGAVVGAVALIRNGFNINQQAHEIEVLAQKIGMSAQAYQEWVYILERVGVSSDKLSDFVKTLTEEQVAVREGSEDMTAAFGKLGLSAEEVINMTQDDLFRETVSRLQNVTNATDRTALAYQLLGEDAAELSNVLRLSNEETAKLAANFNVLGGSMSASLLKKSKELSVSLQNMRAAWQGLRNSLAELVIPILVDVVQWLTKAIALVNMFIRTVFGLDDTPASSTGLEGATNGVGSYTDSVESATKAVEKLKRTTMGFDELKIVQDPNSSAGSSSTGGTGGSTGGAYGGTSSGMGLLDSERLGLSKWKAWFEEYKTIIQDITTWSLIGVGVVGALIFAMSGNWIGALACLALAAVGFAVGNAEDGTFDRLKKNLEDLNGDLVPICMVGIGAIGALYGLLTGNIPLAIAGVAMAGIGLYYLSEEGRFKDVVDKYKEDIAGIAAISLTAIGGAGAVFCLVTGNIVGAIACLALMGTGIYLSNTDMMGEKKDQYKKHVDMITNISIIGIGAVGALYSLMTGNIVGAIAFAAMAGIGVYNLSTGGNFFEDAAKAMKKVWTDVKSWFNSEVAPKFTKKYWSDKFSTVAQGASEKLGAVRTTVMNTWNNTKKYWNDNIAPKFTAKYWAEKFDSIRAGASEKLNAVRTTVMNAWNNIKKYWSENIAPKFTVAYWSGKFDSLRSGAAVKINAVRTTFMNGWNNIKSWFNTNVKSKFTTAYWTAKFDSIKNGAKAAFNGVIGIVEKAVNNIVAKINTLSWKIPSWVPGVGGEKFGFNMKAVKIPRLATGGIATRSTLANIGENGREAILPLENNTSWMDALADKIAAKNSTPTKIILRVGEKDLGWAAINGINQVTKQTGGLQLELV